MTHAPQVSVVMSVYNGAADLRDSIASILAQKGVELEFIIVDDGSTDDSGAILDELSREDHRIRVIHQSNQGLTRALNRGCSVALGEFIARQDCGDASMPGRLRTQLSIMQANAQVALVSCGTRFIGPSGEALYDVLISPSDANDGLLTLGPEHIRGPSHHGSTMFRRALYERVGGYREEFYFAQDLDLWTRLAELGGHIAIATVLYEASFALGSISILYRARQIECARLIIECARRRRAGRSEAEILAQARAIRHDGRATRPSDRAAGLYFIGACLRKRGDPRARKYFREALRLDPLHVRSAMRLLVG